MKDPRFYCVIMAGGVGSRFWPLSRAARPKQFLRFLYSGLSLLRITYDRVKDVVPEENIIVMSLERYRDLVLQEIPELRQENLLLEPFNRNTASCIAYAAYSVLRRDPGATILVSPADQMIEDTEMFTQTALRALDYSADHDVMTMLGVLPTRPDTNFGYIQTDGPLLDGRPVRVKTFTEKPQKELAQVFVDSGEFLWNAGIFSGKASLISREIALRAPEIADQWTGWEKHLGTPSEHDFVRGIYSDMPRISIDYAVMEKSDKVVAIPAFFDWADLGNWESLYEYFAEHDKMGNAVRTGGPFLSRDNSGTIIISPKKDKLVAVKGLKDYMVLDLGDVLFICPREEASLRDFLAELSLPEYEKYR